jgi:hypothetical protein
MVGFLKQVKYFLALNMFHLLANSKFRDCAKAIQKEFFFKYKNLKLM